MRYEDYGIMYKELDKNGQFQEKYTWNRYESMIEWGKYLFLIPDKAKADYFTIRKDEIGNKNFIEFRDFAESKLKYKQVKISEK